MESKVKAKKVKEFTDSVKSKSPKRAAKYVMADDSDDAVS